jgi:hypothetical protein
MSQLQDVCAEAKPADHAARCQFFFTDSLGYVGNTQHKEQLAGFELAIPVAKLDPCK